MQLYSLSVAQRRVGGWGGHALGGGVGGGGGGLEKRRC